MVGGVDIGFTTDGLRGGAQVAAATADAAGAVAARVSGIVVDPTAFGAVAQAGPLAAALTAVRDAAVELGHRVQAGHVELARRSVVAADDGDRLVGVTTEQARSAAPDPIAPPGAR